MKSIKLKRQISHDKINRYLKNEKLTPRILWDNVKDLIEINDNGYLVFDDTVIDKISNNSRGLPSTRLNSDWELFIHPSFGINIDAVDNLNEQLHQTVSNLLVALPAESCHQRVANVQRQRKRRTYHTLLSRCPESGTAVFKENTTLCHHLWNAIARGYHDATLLGSNLIAA